MLHYKTDRRTILKTGGSLVVAFSLAGPLGGLLSDTARAGIAGVDKAQVDSWLEINADGTATVYSGKVDLGTGTTTALAQMAAEELGLPFDKVTMVQGDTDVTPDQGGTWGSLTISHSGVEIRKAAATARAALTAKAAEKLGVAAGDLEAVDGIIRVTKEPARSVTIASLVDGKRFEMPVDPKAEVKDPKTHSIVGKSVPRVDIPDKVTGAFTYMQDVRIPGMLHGRVVRPAAYGAELKSVDESSIADIPGVVKVVREKNFLGVVAQTEWSAIKASRLLKAEWSDWAGLPDQETIYDHVRNTEVAEDKVMGEAGDAKGALRRSTKVMSATYKFAVHTHGSIGPSCALAEEKDGILVVHSPSQAPHFLRNQLADLLKIDKAKVRVVYHEGAGCYGRNGHEDASLDAAILARAVGKPVRVQWMREDEHGWDPKGPPTLVDLRAGLDSKGRVIAWDSQFWEPNAKGGLPPLIGGIHAGLGGEGVMNPGNVIYNADPPYAFSNLYSVVHRLANTPLRPSWIRSPGRMQNTFANECFMDELAANAGEDPIAFRLRYLTDPRGIAVLMAAVRKSGWETRPSPDRRQDGASIARGRGVTYIKYENVRTYVAGVAEVEVDRNTGEIAVKRVVVAHDCGQMINPDGVLNQVEGQIVQTVSRTLMEKVTFDRSKVTSLDWGSYPILKFPQVPKVEVELIDRPDEVPWGAGEPSACVVPSAISNAVFDATGVRLREVPFRPDYVKQALEMQT